MVSLQQSAEQSVIGSLLIDPRCAGVVFEKLRAENFSDPTYRNLFSAAYKVFLEGKPIDPVIVCDAAGGKAYESPIAEIMQRTPTAANVEEYAAIVKGQSRLRQLNNLGMQLASAENYEEGLKLLARAESLLTQSPTRKASTYTDMINEYLDRQTRDEPPNYIDWGIAALNRLRVSPGHFVVLGADSSTGKTALALQLAINIAKKGKRVCFFSYETNRMDAIDRILANTADVLMDRSKDRKLSNKDFAKVYAEGDLSAQVPLTVIESGEYTIDELRAETLAGRYEVIFIDYLQLIPTNQRQTRADEVAAISRALRSMAQRLGVTIVALSQVTPPEKDSKGKRRHLTRDDLRESKQLKMDANEILMLDFEDVSKSYGNRVLIVDKNKDGELGQIRLGFDPQHMRFYVLTRNDKPAKSEARKPDAISGQQRFTELDEKETGPLPFERR